MDTSTCSWVSKKKVKRQQSLPKKNQRQSLQEFRDTVERKREKSMQGGGVCRGSAREKKREEPLSFQSRTTSLLYLAL